MTIPQTNQIINLLQNTGIAFSDGLSDQEIIKIESKFSVKFPPDLKRFLQISLPIGNSFINWRQGLHDEEVASKIISRIEWPLDGILFDIKNGHWFRYWGKEPENLEDRISVAKSCYASAPKMVPIYSHRYIPSEPLEVGNPVFSIYQTDIIYYGYDLTTYFAHEFYFKLNEDFHVPSKPNRKIEFWSWCVENA